MISLRPATVLTIAGSDSGGGAGVQADLRTFAALNLFGASVITAITAQNSRGVGGVWPVPPEQIGAQLEAVETDFRPDAVKIGMLGSESAVAVVASFLERFRPPHVVLDPVLVSTDGVPLLDEGGRAGLINRLLPLVDLVTPNLPEAEILSGLRVENEEGMEAAAHWFLSRGARATLVKGGHLPGVPRDLLLGVSIPATWIEGERVQGLGREGTAGSGVHGTGCVLAAATAARLAAGRELREAVREGKQFVEAAIRGAVTVGQGRPNVEPMAGTGLFSPNAEARHTERLARLKGLYVVTDSRLRPDRDASAVVEAATAGGAGAVQLREKRIATTDLVALARILAARARAAGVLFLVNDRVDVALAAGADGAHVGPDDLPPADARRLLGPERLLGVSVGTVAEAQAAAPYASYFGVGAIFGTRTKADAGAAVTPARIREIRAAAPGIPIVAIGGISRENIGEVAAAGAEAAAVVSAVVAAPDMTTAVQELSKRFRQKLSQVT
jgi:hydroxymethylpyrimidine kinase/phosphomethylpyrimidine kinase/thiamine-phosphate diphosphorylase